MKHCVYVATLKQKPEDTLIYQSLKKYELNYHFYPKNKESLASVYNFSILDAKKRDLDWAILVHDDVILYQHPNQILPYSNYDMVGVAGTSKIEIKSPALWHLMGGGFNSGNLHGKVWHSIDGGPGVLTDFGISPHRCVMIDGVFMALNRKAIDEVEFDEKCPSKYHYYDLCSSLDYHLKGGKVGVENMLICHSSPGLREFTDEWLDGEKYFISKYDKG